VTAKWGPVASVVEAGIVGGLANRAASGSFSEGFPTGAAGYLFNALGHVVTKVPDKVLNGRAMDAPTLTRIY